MKRKIITMMLAVASVLAAGIIRAQEGGVVPGKNSADPNFRVTRDSEAVRQVRLLEDRDQKYMTTKVYDLKSAKAVDITPWILGAVQRYYSYSTVERCKYNKDGKEYLIVNTGVDMIPFVDDMVAKLDRSGKLDKYGSFIDGSGIYRFTYYPRFRFEPALVKLGPTVGSEDGQYFMDTVNSFYYWKDSFSDGKKSYDWYAIFDRPVPQLEVKLNLYEINDNDLKELGIDYVSWKNGPGANLFASGLDFLKFDSFTNISNVTNSLDIASKVSHTWGGFMVAPQIDATFIRLLAQKGKAKIATSSSITVVNDFYADPGNNDFSKAKYKIRFTPSYQDIVKDKDQNTFVKSAGMDFYFYLRKPVINFRGGSEGEKDAVRENGANPTSMEFGYVLTAVDTVEKTSNGTDAQNSYTFRSWASVSTGGEKLLATFDKDQIVEQYNGMPFLGDIPGFKYLVGAATESKSKTKIYLTVSISAANIEADLTDFAGRLVEASEMMRSHPGNISTVDPMGKKINIKNEVTK